MTLTNFLLSVFLFLFSISINAQETGSTFNGRLNITSATEVNDSTYLIGGSFFDFTGNYKADSIDNTAIIVDGNCRIITIDTLLQVFPLSIRVNCNFKPFGQAAIFKPTANHDFPMVPVNIPEKVEKCLFNMFAVEADSLNEVNDYYISNDTLYLTTTDSTYAVIVPTSEDIRVDTVVFGSLPFTPSANAGFTVIMSDGTEFPINFEGALDFLFNDVQLGVYTRNDMTFTKSGYDFVLNTYLTEDVAYPIRPKIYVSETEPVDTITDYPDYALFPGYLWKKPSTGEVWQLNQDMDWILISDLIPEMGTVIDSFTIANDTAYIYLAETTLKAVITDSLYVINQGWKERYDTIYEIINFPLFTQKYALGLNASGSLSAGFVYNNVDSINFITVGAAEAGQPDDTAKKGGWLVTGSGVGDSLVVTAPYGVAIGNSMIRGGGVDVNKFGRLEPCTSCTTFDPDYPDSIGQVTYYLAQLTGYRWYNHGIGGQNTSQIKDRWRRDVLAENYDPSDGRGDQTLPLGRKPDYVYINVGINDITGNVIADSIKARMLWMAKSCYDNDIQAFFNNIPVNENYTSGEARDRRIDDVNKWMMSGVLQAYGATVFDLNSFLRDPNFNDNAHGNDYLADDVHMTGEGNRIFINNIVAKYDAIPILTNINFYARANATLAGFRIVDSISIDGVSYETTANQQLLIRSGQLLADSAIVKILGSGTGSYTGISHIDWILSNKRLSTSSSSTSVDLTAINARIDSTITVIDAHKDDDDDLDPTNELQAISTNGTPGNISLSVSGGTLNLNVNDADADATNELDSKWTDFGDYMSNNNGAFFEIRDAGYLDLDGTFRINDGGGTIIIGDASTGASSTATNSVILGHDAGEFLGGNGSFIMGSFAGQNYTGNLGVGIGSSTLRYATGDYPIAIGYEAGRTTGIETVSIGAQAGYQSGDYGVYIGANAGQIDAGNNYSVFIGNEAGMFSNSNYSVFLGRRAGKFEDTDQKLYIDNSDTSTPLIYGDFVTNVIRINGELEVSDVIGGTPTMMIGRDATGQLVEADPDDFVTVGTDYYISDAFMSGDNLLFDMPAPLSNFSVDLSQFYDNTDDQQQSVALVTSTYYLGNESQAGSGISITGSGGIVISGTTGVSGNINIDGSGITGTDDQNASLSLAGTILTLTIEDGTGDTQDLSSLQDGTGTDDQVFDVATFTGGVLSLSLESDGEATKTFNFDSRYLQSEVDGSVTNEGQMTLSYLSTPEDAYKYASNTSGGNSLILKRPSGNHILSFTKTLDTIYAGMRALTAFDEITTITPGSDLMLIYDASEVGYRRVEVADIRDGTGTDDQVFDVATFTGGVLSLSLESDGQATKTFNFDSRYSQTDYYISDAFMSGDNLLFDMPAPLSNFSVDLSQFYDNTDDQQQSVALVTSTYYLGNESQSGSGISITGSGGIVISGTTGVSGNINIDGSSISSTDDQNLSFGSKSTINIPLDIESGVGVTFREGTNITLDRTASNIMTINSTDTNTNIYNTNGTTGTARTVGITDNLNFGNNLLYLNESGNKIGIKNIAPATTLDITGNLRVSSRGGTPSTLGGWSSSGDAVNVTLGDNLSFDGGALDANITTFYNGNGSVTNRAVTATGYINFDANTLYVNADADRVGIKTNSPSAVLDVVGTFEVSSRTGTATTVAGWASDNKSTDIVLGDALVISSGNLDVAIPWGRMSRSTSQTSTFAEVIPNSQTVNDIDVFTITGNRIEVDQAGDYEIAVSGWLSASGDGYYPQLLVRKNGSTTIINTVAYIETSASDKFSVYASDIVTLSALDEISMYISEIASTGNVTVEEAKMTIKKISD